MKTTITTSNNSNNNSSNSSSNSSNKQLKTHNNPPLYSPSRSQRTHPSKFLTQMAALRRHQMTKNSLIAIILK